LGERTSDVAFKAFEVIAVSVSGFEDKVLRLVMGAVGSYGFALGGGHGLRAHQIVDRQTQDIDGFVALLDPEVFSSAEKEISSVLKENGVQAQIVESNDFLRVIRAVGSSMDENVIIDLNYGHRDSSPSYIEGYGFVLDLSDIVTGKLIAFVERREPRDFIDLAAILDSGEYKFNDFVEILGRVRPDVSMQDISSYFGEIDTCRDRLLGDYGISEQRYQEIKQQLSPPRPRGDGSAP
jgi:hypothetical protein